MTKNEIQQLKKYNVIMSNYKFNIHAYCSPVELATIAEQCFENSCYRIEYANPGTYFQTDCWHHYSRVYEHLRQRNLCDSRKTELDNFATLIRDSTG